MIDQDPRGRYRKRPDSGGKGEIEMRVDERYQKLCAGLCPLISLAG